MLVHQILKSKPQSGALTIRSDATVTEAAAKLAEFRIGSLVVSDDDGATAIGILSERDIVRELARVGAGCMSNCVRDYMTTGLVTCPPDTTVQDVLAKMTDGRFRHMPVVEDGKLVGVITIGDLVKAQLSELSMEKSALEGMIMGH